MRRKTIKPRLDRQEEQQNRRREEEARLLETYIEGESNIDSENLEADDVWKLVFSDGLSIEEKEKIIGKPLPLVSKQESIRRKLEKFDAEQPQFPKGTYQDFEEVYISYQQKFFQGLRDVSPQILEDLRELLPDFKILFGNDDEHYFEIFHALKIELACLTSDFPEYSPLKHDYLWGDTKLLLNITEYAYRCSISVDTNNPPIPEELSDIYQNVTYGRDLFNKILKNKIESFIKFVRDAFQKTTTNELLILPSFLNLQSQIFAWADRYYLSKDWLVEYAHFVLYQMSRNGKLAAREIPIWASRYPSDTKAHDFEFKFRGWWASKQKAEEYEDDLRKAFEENLSNYLSYTYSNLDLDKKIKFTKPKDFENIKWLIAWNEGATMDQIADCYNRSPSTVDSRIDSLMIYDLPKRKGQRGRRKLLTMTQERLTEIKALKIDENLLGN